MAGEIIRYPSGAAAVRPAYPVNVHKDRPGKSDVEVVPARRVPSAIMRRYVFVRHGDIEATSDLTEGAIQDANGDADFHPDIQATEAETAAVETALRGKLSADRANHYLKFLFQNGRVDQGGV